MEKRKLQAPSVVSLKIIHTIYVNQIVIDANSKIMGFKAIAISRFLKENSYSFLKKETTQPIRNLDYPL
jgi:hypothetical protein